MPDPEHRNAVDQYTQHETRPGSPGRRIGPKGILALLCSIYLLAFADRGTLVLMPSLISVLCQLRRACIASSYCTS